MSENKLKIICWTLIICVITISVSTCTIYSDKYRYEYRIEELKK